MMIVHKKMKMFLSLLWHKAAAPATESRSSVWFKSKMISNSNGNPRGSAVVLFRTVLCGDVFSCGLSEFVTQTVKLRWFYTLYCVG